MDCDVPDDEAMVVATGAGEDVVLPTFRLRTGARTGDCGGVTRAAAVAEALEVGVAEALEVGVAEALEVGVGERSGVLLPGGVLLTSTTTELEVDKADTLDDALDRAGESAGVRNGNAGVGSSVGVVLLTTGVGGVNGRCRDTGRGEGGGVWRSLCLVLLGRGCGLKVV
jgi:hypothetical protein